MVVPISAATEVKVGALGKFLKPQVDFLWLLSVCLLFGEVRDWQQQPDMPRLATACGLYTPSSSVCAEVGSCLADTSHFLRGFLKPPCFLINTHLFLSTTEPLRLGFNFSWICVRVSYWMWAFTWLRVCNGIQSLSSSGTESGIKLV